MISESLLRHGAELCLIPLAISVFLVFYRLLRGPTLTDRVLALDLMTTIIMAIISVYALSTGDSVFVDVTLAFALVAFVSTAVFARHIDREGAGKKKEKSRD